jgi:hypothetical protein
MIHLVKFVVKAVSVHVNFHFQFQLLTCLLTISTFDQPHLILWLFDNGLIIFCIWMICAAVPIHLLTFSLLYVSFGFREVAMHTQATKENKFWSWKCHVSMTNSTPESNEVSLESSCLLLLCCEGKSPIQGALETLKVKTNVPWQHNQTKTNFELERPHLNDQ